jgi:hypothetical protein
MNDTIELQEIMPVVQQPQGRAVAISATPSDLLRLAVEQGADLDKLERLMVLKREWDADEARKAFREDFSTFRGENIIIPKTKHVDRGRGGSFTQAEYDQVCGRLSPALSRHGFSFRHDQKFGVRRIMSDGVENDAGWVWVTCHLEHRKGHTESLELEGPPGDLTVNTPTQNMQVTASYLKRQSLLAITGTATGGEDDEAKMRGRAADGQDADKDAELHQAGRDAAMSGIKALTDWWGKLDAAQRSRLNKEFGGLRKAAQEADRA